jgi:hypothetical protein
MMFSAFDHKNKRVRKPAAILGAVFLGVFGVPPKVSSQEIRPGVWAGRELQTLPLPATGYQAYLVGEWHGLEENPDFQSQYLALLHKTSGLRDVAIEERGVYEDRAQAYVSGKSDALPGDLCRRAGLIQRIRLLNAGLPESARIRIHLVDIDSPVEAIHEHLVMVRQRIAGAAKISIPPLKEIKEHGLKTVAQLQQFTMDSRTRSELRTIEHSIRAYQQGLEFGTGPAKGSPYIDDREDAIASNIADLVRSDATPSVLVLYGSDHVSKSRKKDGGPNRDQPFWPMAHRLEQSGISVFSTITFPLAGRYDWREGPNEMPFGPQDFHLASGETLDKMLADVPEARFIYVDTKRQRITLTDDASRFAVEAFVLFPTARPLKDECKAH